MSGSSDGEKKFLESEGFAHLLLEFVSSGIWWLDTDGNTTFVNSAAARMLGYAPVELIGKPMNALVHHSCPDGSPYPSNQCPMYATCVDGEEHTVSYEALWRKDGSSVPIEYTTHALHNNNVLIGTAIIFQDITERKKLLESEIKYKRLVENTPAIIYEFSDKHGGIYYSQKAAEILGYPLEYLYANPFLWNESIHPDDKPAVTESIKCYKEKGVFDITYQIRNAHGDWLWFHDISIGKREENGEVIINGLACDITERKLAEGQIRHSEEKFSKVFRDSPNAIIISEIDTGLVSEVNRSFIDLFGYSEQDVIGLTTTDFGLWLDMDSRNAVISIIKAQGYLYNHEVRHRTKDGRILTLIGSSTQLHSNEKDYLVVHLLDITERKAAEDALIKSEANLRATLDNLPFITWIKDSEGRFTTVNK